MRQRTLINSEPRSTAGSKMRRLSALRIEPIEPRHSVFEPASSRRRKGVYEVVEEVILFGVGIVIMVGMVGLFNNFEKSMLSSLGESRLDAANKYVASSAIALAATNCTRCYVTIAMPPFIGGEKYIVGGSADKKTVIYAAGKYALEESITAPAEGQADSAYRSLQVEYTAGDGKIKIYGVSNY